jgi:hypothetical protein
MATAVPTKPDPTADLIAQIDDAERQTVLAAFAELKKRDAGELRIAVRLNRQTGVREIVYLGVHEQQNVDRLKKLYGQLLGRNGTRPVTF